MNQFKCIFLILACTLVASQSLFYSGGGCSQIEGVGSPVLMVAQAHQYVNRALDSKNPYTYVKMIYNNTPELQSDGQFLYKYVFNIQASGKTMYYGIQFTAGSNTNMALFKLVFTDKLSTIGTILSEADLANNLSESSCGDLKFIFSSYGKDPTADLPYAFPNNRNSVGLNLLSRLSETKQNEYKECINKNYTIYEWFSESMSTHTTLVNCIPMGIPIHSIRLGCYNAANNPVQASAGSHIEYIQLIYNNSDGTTTASEEIKSTSFTLGDEVVIPVDTGAFITFNAYGNETAEIVLKDENLSTITTWNCGADTISAATLELSETYPVKDFLGFDYVDTSGQQYNFMSVVIYED